MPQLVSLLRDEVMQALDQPCHKGIPTMEARKYISVYEINDAKHEIILKLAKLDFSFLQNLYKKELILLMRYGETREGNIMTGIECFMKHYGVSKQVAMKKFVDAAEDGWKDVNTEWIANTNN
ncbi:hypothetical protein RD792_013741 [Penstemon davidsonii]|uniref:Uncharacterized protein n=1 Tax=Penstemon davidsonii TaxID=160366 RepID=A0ABR0CUB3_9LAMI|nr:hypothetical protein RD792_013741 [Penstemon davidsonii]